MELELTLVLVPQLLLHVSPDIMDHQLLEYVLFVQLEPQPVHQVLLLLLVHQDIL